MKQRKLSYVSGFWAFFTRVQPSTAGPPSHNDSVANPTSLSIPIFTMSHPHNTHPCAVTHQPRPNVNEILSVNAVFGSIEALRVIPHHVVTRFCRIQILQLDLA